MPQIQSPLPGTFYNRANPESEPFKKTGDTVSATDTIGLIEVMKTFIEIKADVEGVFVEYAAKDGDPVAAGQVLAELEG